jgi:cation diffusion facilitator family transporter
VTSIEPGIRAAQTGLVVNLALAAGKLAAGILGNSYALIADAVESTTDVFSSLIVWGGLRVAGRPADESHPYGHGKAEALTAVVVALMLFAAAAGVAVASIRALGRPNPPPEPFTLAVLAVVIVVKEVLFRRVLKVGDKLSSTAVMGDAWHHRADALTSAAAFIGIGLAIFGGGVWQAADEWAALLATVVIAYSGVQILVPAVNDLMDRRPDAATLAAIEEAAKSIDGVRATEKLRVRKLGVDYFVDLHVQADPAMSLHDAHVLSGKVKGAIRAAVPTVKEALIHMEPFE